MGIKRIVDTSFWTDGKVDEFSPEDKYFMLYLLTNPFSTQLGIYEISIKQVAFQLGYSMDAVKVLIDRFENKYGIIAFSPNTNEIAIKNFLRHSIIKGGKPVEDCIKKEMLKVKNTALISHVFQHIADKGGLNETVLKIINEYEDKNEIENDNDNDNDESSTIRQRFVNESPYTQIKADILDNKGEGDKVCAWCGCKTTVLHAHHYPVPKRLGGKEVVNICSNCHHEFHLKEGQMYGDNHTDLTTPVKPAKPTKHKYGEYRNVLLTDVELDKLKTQFPADYMQRIENLSAYIASKGAKYKSHYATIRCWASNDKKRATQQKTQSKPSGNVFLDFLDDGGDFL